MKPQQIKVFKALSNKTRLNLIKNLIKHKEVSCQRLMKKIPLSQPTLAHHFHMLIDAGILSVRKNGVYNYYSIDKKYLHRLGISIEKIVS